MNSNKLVFRINRNLATGRSQMLLHSQRQVRRQRNLYHRQNLLQLIMTVNHDSCGRQTRRSFSVRIALKSFWLTHRQIRQHRHCKHPQLDSQTVCQQWHQWITRWTEMTAIITLARLAHAEAILIWSFPVALSKVTCTTANQQLRRLHLITRVSQTLYRKSQRQSRRKTRELLRTFLSDWRRKLLAITKRRTLLLSAEGVTISGIWLVIAQTTENVLIVFFVGRTPTTHLNAMPSCASSATSEDIRLVNALSATSQSA